MNNVTFTVKKREEVGKNSVDKLRRERLIPGVLYGKEQEPINIVAVEKELVRLVEEAGTSNLIDLTLDGATTKVLIKDVQNHPYKNQILHFDLYVVNMKETLRISIPVVLHNRDNIKAQPSVLLQQLDEVEVECLPTNLPSAAEFDVENLEIGDVVTVSQLDVASIPEITVLTDLEETVCSLQEPQEEELPEEGEESEEVDAADVPTVDETESEEE